MFFSYNDHQIIKCAILRWLLFFSLPFCLAADEGPLTIVFCNDGFTNPYHIEWLAGFEAALKAYDDAFGGVEGYWRGTSRVEVQLEQVEEAIDAGVDILFVNSISETATEPLMEKAQEKGIVWVSVHNPMEKADYNFLLGDTQNGYNQGMALATYFDGRAKVAIMLGARGMESGENRLQGILQAFEDFPGIEVVAREPADWDTTKALRVVERLYSSYPDLDALSVVTDSYLYPAIPIAREMGLENLVFFGYDGDKVILDQMGYNGPVKGDVLLSATREGWNFVHMAYRIYRGEPVEKDYYFYTPLVLDDETYRQCLENGFPREIDVYSVEDAKELAEKGSLEYGPDFFLPGGSR